MFFSMVVLQSYITIVSDDSRLDTKLRGMSLKLTLDFVCRNEKSSLFEEEGYAGLTKYLNERVREIEGKTIEDLSTIYSVSPGMSQRIKKTSSGLNRSPKLIGFRKVYDNVMQPISPQKNQDLLKKKQKREFNQSVDVVAVILIHKYGYQPQDILNQNQLQPSVETEIEK